MVASGAVVALIPPNAEMNALAGGEQSQEWVTMWVAQVCAEDGAEEVAAWTAELIKMGVRSKRRLANITSVDQLTAIGINQMAAVSLVQQAQRVHGVAVASVVDGVEDAGSGGSSSSWGLEGKDFPKPRVGSGAMALPDKAPLEAWFSKAVYGVKAEGRDIGERLSMVVQDPTMSDEDFEEVEDGATSGDQASLAAYLAGAMDASTLSFIEAKVGKAATGLAIARALLRPYATLGEVGIKGLREKVLVKVPLVCQASASTSLALWRSNVRDLEHRGERPSPSQLRVINFND